MLGGDVRRHAGIGGNTGHAGRIIILNAKCLPAGNALAPGCWKGRNLMSSNLAIRPGTDNIGGHGVEIRVFKHDVRGLAAQLEQNTLEVGCPRAAARIENGVNDSTKSSVKLV